MYKGFFKVESMQKPKRGNLKSYSNKRASYAKSFAVCFAIVTLASCGEKTGNSMFQTVKNAADAYRSYLSEVRKEANLPTDRLIEKINDWQSLRDSVSACVAKDTANRIHANYESEIRGLHDSLRIEFTRLALEKPRTFADVLLIREQTSQYRQDTELMRSAAEAGPFFKPLDSVPTYKGSANAVVEKYRMFLSKTLKSGISGKSEMLAFIKEEDRLFRSLLSHLPELADIARSTDQDNAHIHLTNQKQINTTVMLQLFYDDFLSFVPLQLPQLLDVTTMEQPQFYDDYVLLSFPLADPYDLEEVMDIFEDDMELITLYHHIPSSATTFGSSTCAYSNPAFGQMFKMNARVSDTGKVDRIDVTIYESLEFMCSDICLDLKLHEKTGHFKYRKTKEELLAEFI